MIAANYTMHVYCDCLTCTREHWNRESAEFIGTSWTDVLRKARAAGWKISADRERAFAPHHAVRRNADVEASGGEGE